MKSRLVKHGIPEGRIEVIAVGEKQNLSRSDVMKLHGENPNKPSFAKRNLQALEWAYNRRADITLLPTGQKSSQFFPGYAEEARVLFQSEWQPRRVVEKAGEEVTTTESPAGQPRDRRLPGDETAAAQTPTSN